MINPIIDNTIIKIKTLLLSKVITFPISQAYLAKEEVQLYLSSKGIKDIPLYLPQNSPILSLNKITYDNKIIYNMNVLDNNF